MPSSYSTRARFTLQATGENFNTWGVILNAQSIQLIDDNVNGVVAFTLSGAKTLTTANGATDEARMSGINVTGGTGGTITIPAVSTHYWVRNGAIGNVIISTGGATTATVYPNETIAVMTDGAAVYRVRPNNLDGVVLNNLGAPAANSDAATKLYVDQAVSGVLAGPYPPQAGQAGKFIGTDGALVGWTDTSALTWNIGGLRLGGLTAAFPMLKRAGTTVQHRLADDSGDAPASAATANQFDNTVTLATTAFVKRSLGALSALIGLAANTTLTAAHAGFGIVATAGGITLTLPLSTAIPAGGRILFTSTTTNVTVARQGADVIQLNPSSTAIVLNAGDTLTLVSGGDGNWWPGGGSAQLPSAAVMSGPNWTTPAQFDNTNRLATTAFLQRALGNRSVTIPVSTSPTTLNSANVGAAVFISGASGGTLNIPLAAGCPNGSTFIIYNTTSFAWTIARQGGDLFVLGNTLPATFILEGGGFVFLTSNQSNNAWYAAGSASLGASGYFTKVVGTTGYQYFPGGNIMQWQVSTSSASAGIASTFSWALAFPANYGALLLTGWSAGNSPMANCHGYNISRTQFQCCCIIATTQFSAWSTGN